MAKDVYYFEWPVSLDAKFMRGVGGLEIFGVQPNPFSLLVSSKGRFFDHEHLTMEDCIMSLLSNLSEEFLSLV